MNDSQPAGLKVQYIASLVDIEDQDVTYSNETIEATTKPEAISKARHWALKECQETGKALLIVTAGGPGTVYGEVFDPGRASE